jgi:hypothetical protein
LITEDNRNRGLVRVALLPMFAAVGALAAVFNHRVIVVKKRDAS